MEVPFTGLLVLFGMELRSAGACAGQIVNVSKAFDGNMVKVVVISGCLILVAVYIVTNR